MENVKGKEISLLGKAVKIPGHNKPRGSEALKTGAGEWMGGMGGREGWEGVGG